MIKIHLILLNVMALSHSTNAGGFYKSHVFEKEFGPITKVSIDQENGDIFVGGTNVFAHLNQELQVIHMRVLGPVNDSQKCKPRDNVCIGNVHSNFTETNDIVKVLVYNEHRQRLIVCGSAHQGMCFLYNPKTNFSDMSIETASLIGGKNTTVMVQSLKRNSDKIDGDMYFIGQSYDGRNLRYFHSEFSKLVFQNGSEGFELKNYAVYANLSVCQHLKKTFHIRFIYGFESGNNIYFVFVRTVYGDNPGRQYETKLAQLCRNDDKFNSYIEFPLICTTNKTFNMASSAFFDRYGNVADNNGTLYVTFGINNWRTGHLQDPLEGSALCKFQMIDIEKKIRSVFRLCLLNESGSTPDWRCEKYPCFKPSQIKKKPGNCRADIYEGIQALSENNLSHTNEFTINDELMTSVAITHQGNERGVTIAIIGTDKGSIRKLLKNNASFKVYAKYKLSEEKIEPDIVFDKNHTSAYVSTAEKIFKIDLMSCQIHQTCNDCVTTIDPLGCGWCGNHCSTNDSCQGVWYNDTCPPFVHSIYPTSGPVSGNTALTITGQHFGSEMAERNVYLQHVNGNSSILNCNITTALDSRIICLTESSPNSGVYAVKVEVTDTIRRHRRYFIKGVAELLQFNFTYFEPEIHDVAPLFGPKFGNTSVTIVGKHLEIGSFLEVSLAEFSCDIESSQFDTIICRTSSWSQDVKTEKTVKEPDSSKCIDYGPVTVKIDEGLVWNQNESNFCYMDDPEITNIYPHKTIKSGGLNLTIEGTNFDAVRKHEIVVRLYTEGKYMMRKCTSNVNGTRLICPIPSYDGDISDGANVKGYIVPEFDGMLNFSDRYKGNSNLTFYPDPLFNNLREDVEALLQDQSYSITLKGKNLNLALTKDDFFITINNARCKVYELTETFLRCRIGFMNFSQQYMRIEVRFGNIERNIGGIHFIQKLSLITSEQVTSSNNAGLSGGVAAAVLLCIVIVVIIVVMKWRTFRRESNIEITALDTNISSFVPPTNVLDERVDCQRAKNDDSGNDRYSNATKARQPLLEEGHFGGASDNLSSVDHGTVEILEKQNLLIDRNHLVLGENLGHGEFGCVYKGYLRKSGEKAETAVAVKTILKSGYGSNVEEFLNEALMMKDFNHPNVLKLIGISLEEGEFPLVILPFMKLGDILMYIRNDENTPTVKDLVSFGIDIAQGMEYLSGIKYIHRDLAARNCMLDEHKTVKVADFGLSRDIYSKEYYSCDNKKKLPVKWMAPESLEKGTYTSKSDVWSYGVVLWELLTRGASPYPGVENWDVALYIKMGRRLPRPEYCPKSLYLTMTKCWEYNPGQRPTFKELVDEIMDIVLNKSQETRVKDIPVDLDKCTNYDYGDKHIPDWATELQINFTSASPTELASQLTWTQDHPETVNMQTHKDVQPNSQKQVDSATVDNSKDAVHFQNTGIHNKAIKGSGDYYNTVYSTDSVSSLEEICSLSENTCMLNESSSNRSSVENRNMSNDGVLVESDNS